MDHHVCAGQVEARAARLERDEEHVRAALVELPHQFHARLLVRFAGQREVRDSLAGKRLADEREHRGELREQQDAVPAGERVLHHLQQLRELAAAAIVVFKAEPRVAAQLPQPGQPREQLHPVLTVKQAALAVLFELCRVGGIELALLRRQLAAHHRLHLLRQVGEHILLHAPQDERRNQQVQVFPRLLVRFPHDRRLKAVPELLVGAKIPRHQEVEEGPQLGEPVFNRRAGHREAVLRLQRLDRLRRLRGGVFDVLCLVQQHMRELDALICLHVPAQLVVGGHQDVRRVLAADQLHALLRGAHQAFGRQAGRKALRLREPVELKRRRAHHQRAHGTA